MEKLIASKLFGDGLIEIHKPSLIERYNACLEDIGLKPTKLKKFNIDGWGWSPEISNEQNNHFYLSHNGPANPFAIIITPEQEDKPIYFPYHSFDKDLMRIVFHTARPQIVDLSTESGIWIDVDQEINHYRSPQDLLMVDSINLKFNTPNKLIDAAREQRELVRQFYGEKYAWGDTRLHKKIYESSKRHGDLRFRSLDIPNMPYTHVRTFYTRAFEGLFVFRDTPNNKPILILENQKSELSGELFHGHLEFNINDKGLMGALIREKLIDGGENFDEKSIQRMHQLLDFIFVQACSEEAPDELVWNMPSGKRKGLIASLRGKTRLIDMYDELQFLIKEVSMGKTLQILTASIELQNLLAEPYDHLPTNMKKVVWKLLVKLSPLDIAKLYQYNKEAFFTEYQNWPENYQKWVTQYLQKNYLNQPEAEPVN